MVPSINRPIAFFTSNRTFATTYTQSPATELTQSAHMDHCQNHRISGSYNKSQKCWLHKKKELCTLWGTAGFEQMWRAKGREVGPSAEGVCRSSLGCPRCRGGGVRVTCPGGRAMAPPLVGIWVVPGGLLHALDSVCVVTFVVALRKSCHVFVSTPQHKTNHTVERDTQSWSQRCRTS